MLYVKFAGVVNFCDDEKVDSALYASRSLFLQE